jgi:hypothetical protein
VSIGIPVEAEALVLAYEATHQYRRVDPDVDARLLAYGSGGSTKQEHGGESSCNDFA